MPFDFKKEQKTLYQPPTKPVIVEIPEMQYLAVRGTGNPNEEGGDYQTAIGLLYGVAYTLKMSAKGGYHIPGFFDYVVPPLEGFWWQEGGIDYAHKDAFHWISIIRAPDFVRATDFDWAIGEAARKKKTDFSNVELFHYEEGLCVQCLHLGSYDDEPATIQAMEDVAKANGYQIDITPQRYHHEIYLNDPRKVAAAKRKTVIRHPIKPNP